MIEFTIKVIPKSSVNRLEVKDGAVRLKITAPPVDGKANQAVIAFLAKTFGTAKSAITIVRGETSRHKTVRIDEINDAEAEKILSGFEVSS